MSNSRPLSPTPLLGSLYDLSSRSEQFEQCDKVTAFITISTHQQQASPAPQPKRSILLDLRPVIYVFPSLTDAANIFASLMNAANTKKKRTQMLTCKSNEPLVFQATPVWLAVWGPRAERMRLSCTVLDWCHTCSHGGSSECGPSNTPPVHNTLYSHGLRTALNERHPNTQQNKSTCWTHWSSKINSYKALKRKKAWQTLVWPWNDVSVTTSWCGHTGLETDLS